MKWLDLTLDRPEANLALDEALLVACDSGVGGAVLRVWEARSVFVVLGHGKRVAEDVFVDRARRDGVPVLRRCSGGGTVLQMPGCLNYSLVMPIGEVSSTLTISGTNQFVMDRQQAALVSEIPGTEVRGVTDLAVKGVKFSGNAQRRKKNALLFHGVFLLAGDLELIERYLKMPTLQPEYRQRRSHRAFLKNVSISSHRVKTVLKAVWQAEGSVEESWKEAYDSVIDRYFKLSWHHKF